MSQKLNVIWRELFFGEPYREGGSRAEFAFDLDISPMEFNDFLDEGETNP